MKRVWIAAAATAAALACVGGVAAQTPPGHAIEDFVAGPTLSSVSISPSGTHLAMIVTSGDVSRLVVHDLAGGDYRSLMEARFNESFGGTMFDSFNWKGDEHILVSARLFEVERRRGQDDGRITSYRYGRLVMALNRDGSAGVELRAPAGRQGSPGVILDILENSPHEVLMTARDWSGGLDVARVDIRTGDSVEILEGDRRAVGYYTDHNGEIVARVREALSGHRQMIESRDPETGDWIKIAEITPGDLRDLDEFTVLGAAEAPGVLYVMVRPESGETPDTTAIHLYDMRERQLGEPLWRHERYDVAGMVTDQYDRFIAGCFRADVHRCEFQDDTLRAHMTGLSRFFEDSRDIFVASQSRENDKWVLFVTGPDEPGTYYLYDLTARSVDVIGPAYGRVALEGLGAMRRIDYAARDGAALHGYLTWPGDVGGSTPPLIVMPHGGPEARDSLAYDPWVQFLATRGYAVFQPNFRGSSGFGRAYVEAGHGQWGLRMQDDVTDGVSALIEQGLADPARICILGASYGGYAALWGGAREPDLYRCVVSVSGVSDLPAMMRWERREQGARSDAYDYWLTSIGDPRADRTRLESVSPIRFVDEWRPPVLLIHGDEDQIVPHEQSRDMERALRRAGKDVRFITLEGEDHNDWRQDDHILALREIEAFLAEHLPVD